MESATTRTGSPSSLGNTSYPEVEALGLANPGAHVANLRISDDVGHAFQYEAGHRLNEAAIAAEGETAG